MTDQHCSRSERRANRESCRRLSHRHYGKRAWIELNYRPHAYHSNEGSTKMVEVSRARGFGQAGGAKIGDEIFGAQATPSSDNIVRLRSSSFSDSSVRHGGRNRQTPRNAPFHVARRRSPSSM